MQYLILIIKYVKKCRQQNYSFRYFRNKNLPHEFDLENCCGRRLPLQVDKPLLTTQESAYVLNPNLATKNDVCSCSSADTRF